MATCSLTCSSSKFTSSQLYKKRTTQKLIKCKMCQSNESDQWKIFVNNVSIKIHFTFNLKKHNSSSNYLKMFCGFANLSMEVIDLIRFYLPEPDAEYCFTYYSSLSVNTYEYTLSHKYHNNRINEIILYDD